MKHLRLQTWRMTALLALLVAWLAPVGAWAAAAVEIDGIYYKLDATRNTAQVTSHPDKYSGEITVPSSVTSDGTVYTVTAIGYDAFYNCPNLTSLSLPNTLVEIGSWGISMCSNLTSLTLPESLTTIRQYGIYNLPITQLTIPKNVTTIEALAINRNQNLTTLKVAAGNNKYDSRGNCNAIIETADNKLICVSKGTTAVPASVTAYGDHCLESSGLSGLTVNEGTTYIGEFAFGNTSIENVVIPATVTFIGQGAFRNIYRATSMSVDAGNPYYESPNGCNAIIQKSSRALIASCINTVIPDVEIIAAHAFNGIGKTSIELPSSVVMVDSYAFANCWNLEKVVLNEGLAFIREFALGSCENLYTITLPSTLQEMGERVFEGCRNLTSVTCLATTPPTYPEYGSSMYGYDGNMSGVTLHVPAGTESDYQAAAGWREFGTIVGDAGEGGGESASFTSTFTDIEKTGDYSAYSYYEGRLLAEESTSGVGNRDWIVSVHNYPNTSAAWTLWHDQRCVYICPETPADASSPSTQMDFYSQFRVTGKVKNIVVNCGNNINFMVALLGGVDDYYGYDPGGTGLRNVVIDCNGFEVTDQEVHLILLFNKADQPFFIKSITINMVDENGGGGQQQEFPIYEGDQGTPSAPYQIKTTDDLDLLAKLCNEGNDFYGKYFLLTADLDYGYVPGGGSNVKEFASIGTDTGSRSMMFRGVFNGGGHTISGLILSKNSYNGVFGYIDSDGVVRNLRVASSRITGYNSGAIAGNNYGLIENCHTAADVEVGDGGYGGMTIGGIAGLSMGTIQGCTNQAMVMANRTYGNTVGGIVGANRGTIRHCLNLGVVVAGYQVGNIAGNEVYNTYGTPVLDYNFYYNTTNTMGGFNGYDRAYGAMQATVSTSNPGLGSQVANYGAVTAYDIGLYFNGNYYTAESWPVRGFSPSNSPAGGSGTEDDPFIIDDVFSLKQLSSDVLSGTDYAGKYFALSTDIKLSSATGDLSSLDENFTPIGNPATPFRGILDGRGHKISGVVVKRTTLTDKGIGVGIFGFIRDNAAVRNLIVANSYFHGAQRIGGIVGDMRQGTAVENCHVLSDVQLKIGGGSSSNIGGIVGIMQGDLLGCTSAAKIGHVTNETPTFMGGIAGQAGVGQFKDCLSLATISNQATDKYNVGAISGSFYSDVKAANNFYCGDFGEIKAVGTGKNTCADRADATKGYEFTTKPFAVGAQVKQYATYGVTSFEHGLLYNSKYYCADETGGQENFSVAGIYYELDDATHEATVIADPSGAKYTGAVEIPATVLKDNGNVYTVTAIGDKAFQDCTELTSVKIGDNVETIGSYAFQTCDKLTQVTWNNKLKIIGDHAFNATMITGDVTLPATVEVIGPMAFHQNDWITGLHLGAKVRIIGYWAFGSMYDLATITVDDANTHYASPNDCNAILARNYVTNELDTLVAGSNGTKAVPYGVKYICAEAFSLRQNLNVSLPATIEEIENYAFSNARINDLYITTTQLPRTAADAFEVGEMARYSNLHVLPDLVNTFKTTAPWSLFQNVLAIETVEPRSAEEPLPTVEDLAQENLEDAVIEGVYYNLDTTAGSGVDTEDPDGACIVIGETTNMDEISDPTPGIPEMAEKFKGIAILLQAGKGTLSIAVKTVGTNELAVKIGDGEEQTFSKSSKGTVNVPYNVTEPTYAYIYAVSGAAGARVRRAANGDSGVRIYDINVTTSDILMGDVNGDEKVDVTDVTAVINKILGKNPQPFNEAAADVKADGIIDVSDVTAIINIILGKK